MEAERHYIIILKQKADLIIGDCGTVVLLYMTESRLCPWLGVCELHTWHVTVQISG